MLVGRWELEVYPFSGGHFHGPQEDSTQLHTVWGTESITAGNIFLTHLKEEQGLGYKENFIKAKASGPSAWDFVEYECDYSSTIH